MLRWLRRRGGKWLETGGKRWRVDRAKSGVGAMYERFEIEQVHSKTAERRWIPACTGRPPVQGRWTMPDGEVRWDRYFDPLYWPSPERVAPWEADTESA